MTTVVLIWRKTQEFLEILPLWWDETITFDKDKGENWPNRVKTSDSSGFLFLCSRKFQCFWGLSGGGYRSAERQCKIGSEGGAPTWNCSGARSAEFWYFPGARSAVSETHDNHNYVSVNIPNNAMLRALLLDDKEKKRRGGKETNILLGTRRF